MQIQTAINQVIEKNDLSSEDMQSVMRQIMTGEASDAQIAGFLVALRMKGETVNEIAAAASVMRELASRVSTRSDSLVDIVGTGGDGAKLFNVSTASSFVVAAAGCHVAKHGNRSVSSSSGSADLLESAGVALDLSAEEVARCIDEVGVGFMFAVNHHRAMKHAIGPRKELATRTIFNMLGPMTNPAGAENQLLGVYDKALVLPIAEAMKSLGSKHVLVVHSADGLDEISIAAETYVAELKDGEISEYLIQPEDFNIQRTGIEPVTVQDSSESLALIEAAFDRNNSSNPEATAIARNIIALNAGAALYAAGNAATIKLGVETAQDIIASGTAGEKLKQLADFSQLIKQNRQ